MIIIDLYFINMPVEYSNIQNKCNTFDSSSDCSTYVNFMITPTIKAPVSEIMCQYLLIHPTTHIKTAMDYRQTMTFMYTATLRAELSRTSVKLEPAQPPHRYTSTPPPQKTNKIIKLGITHE